jgi:hypothetical protein
MIAFFQVFSNKLVVAGTKSSAQHPDPVGASVVKFPLDQEVVRGVAAGP